MEKYTKIVKSVFAHASIDTLLGVISTISDIPIDEEREETNNGA